MKKFKSIIAGTLITAMALSGVACSKKSDKISDMSSEDFIEVCEEMGFKKTKDSVYDKEYKEYKKSDMDELFDEYVKARGRNSEVTYYFKLYKDAYDANESFESYYLIYDDENEYYDGTVDSSFHDGKDGYIVWDGEVDEPKGSDYEIYGGLYYSGNMIIVAYCESDSISNKAKEEIDEFIDLLGYPAP